MWQSGQSRPFRKRESKDTWVRIPPPPLSLVPDDGRRLCIPTGRGRRLRTGDVWVRIPPELLARASARAPPRLRGPTGRGGVFRTRQRVGSNPTGATAATAATWKRGRCWLAALVWKASGPRGPRVQFPSLPLVRPAADRPGDVAQWQRRSHEVAVCVGSSPTIPTESGRAIAPSRLRGPTGRGGVFRTRQRVGSNPTGATGLTYVRRAPA